MLRTAEHGQILGLSFFFFLSSYLFLVTSISLPLCLSYIPISVVIWKHTITWLGILPASFSELHPCDDAMTDTLREESSYFVHLGYFFSSF